MKIYQNVISKYREFVGNIAYDCLKKKIMIEWRKNHEKSIYLSDKICTRRRGTFKFRLFYKNLRRVCIIDCTSGRCEPCKESAYADDRTIPNYIGGERI